MKPDLRLILALLLGLFAAAALGRAEMGADAAGSVLFAPAFQRHLLPALLMGWWLAPLLGRPGLAGWLRAASIMAFVTTAAACVTAFALGNPPLALLGPLTRNPQSLIALGLGAVGTQALALWRKSGFRSGRR